MLPAELYSECFECHASTFMIVFLLQQYLLVTKIVDHEFFLDVRDQREVIWCQARAVRRMTHQFNVLGDQKDAALPMSESSHCHGEQ